MEEASRAKWVSRSAIWDGRSPPRPGTVPDAPWQKLCPYCDAPIGHEAVFQPGHCDAQACGERHMLLLNYLAEEGRRAAYHRECDGAEARAAAAKLADAEGCAEHDVVSVVVPFQDAPVAGLPEGRRAAFLAHLEAAVDEAFAIDAAEITENPLPEPADDITVAGCSTCRGFCCRQGADRFAFLSAGELAEIRMRRPDLDADGMRAFYEDALPEASVDGSCVFQGPEGCVLSRQMRASVCNSFHCRELIGAFARVRIAPDAPVVVLARTEDGVQSVGALGVNKEWRLL